MRENSVCMKHVLQMDGHHIVLVTPDDADWLVFYSEWMEPEENEFLKIKKRNDFDRHKETKLVCVCAPLFFFILSWTQVLLRTRPTTSDPIDPCPTGFKWFCVWSFSNSVQSINLQSKRFRKQNLELLFISFQNKFVFWWGWRGCESWCVAPIDGSDPPSKIF